VRPALGEREEDRLQEDSKLKREKGWQEQEGGKEWEREGGREGKRTGGRERGREGGREGRREGGSSLTRDKASVLSFQLLQFGLGR